MNKTCKEVLLEYLKQNEGWHKKVSLYVIAEDWSPESAGRALRTLAEEKIINVDYYDSKYAKNLAKYSYGKQKEKKTTIEIRDGKAIITEYWE